MGYANCETQLRGGCVAECEQGEVTLDCDGQYVDHEGNAEECVNALEAAISARVDGYARGSAECSGNSCEAEGEAGCSARMAPALPGGGAAAALAALGLALTLGARRRSRRG
jgi:hypothetical protein